MLLKKYHNELIVCKEQAVRCISKTENLLLGDTSKLDEARKEFDFCLNLISTTLNSPVSPPNFPSEIWKQICIIKGELVELGNQVQGHIRTLDFMKSMWEQYGDKITELIFCCDKVQIYLIFENGLEKKLFVEDGTLLLFGFEDKSVSIGWRLFILVDEWFYSFDSFEVLKDDALLVFPEKSSPVKGSTVALLLRPEDNENFIKVLERFEITVTEYSQGISTDLAAALTYGAGKIANFVTYVTPSVIQYIPKSEEPVMVSENVTHLVSATKSVTAAAASGSSYLASVVRDTISSVAGTVGPIVTTVIAEGASEAGFSNDSIKNVGMVFTKVGDLINGFNVVMDGVKDSGKIIGTSMASSTVQIVNHRYGQNAGELTENALSTVGNVVETSINFRSLMPKTIFKNSIKKTISVSGPVCEEYCSTKLPSIQYL